MPTIEYTDCLAAIPPPDVVRRDLGQAERKVQLLRRLLAVSEAASAIPPGEQVGQEDRTSTAKVGR